jgi:hypothetical protein
VVLLEPEGDVEQADGSETVDLGALPESDRRSSVATVLPDAEAQVLAVADRRRRDGLRRRDEQRDVRVSETEGRKSPELLGEVERELARGDDSVDLDDLEQVVCQDVGVRVRGEGVGERGDRLLGDRLACSRTVAAEALEMSGARGERAMEVEVRNRAPRALPAVM